MTPGEGFHVKRITKGGSTPGTTRAGTDEGVDVRIEILDDSKRVLNGVDVVEKDMESIRSSVSQHEGGNVYQAEEGQ